MRFLSDEVKLDFSDVLILPKTSELTTRSSVSTNRTFKLKHAGWEWSGTPIIAANMDTTGTFEMSETLSCRNLMTALHKHYRDEDVVDHFSRNEEAFKHTFMSFGTSDYDLETCKEISSHLGPRRLICVDVANGYTQKFIDGVKKYRELNPEAFIMAGNVVTPEKSEEIINAGADCVKVGIGPGSVCTTRIKTGVGYPQLSAIIECADAVHGVKGLICADGGCSVPGDVVKAFAAGADFVMIAGMLAGTEQCAGEQLAIHPDGSEFSVNETNMQCTHMRFYGMSSEYANDMYNGGLGGYKAAEGKSVLVEYRGDVNIIIDDILGGIRSAMTYTGSTKLKELTKRTTFVKVNNQHNRIFD